MEKKELLYKPVAEPNTRSNNFVGRGRPDKTWLQLLYIYYLAWKDNPDQCISVREVKKQYAHKIKEYGFDKLSQCYMTNRSINLYRYGYLTKIKADDGSNQNLYRINDDGLEKLEDRDIIPPEARKEFISLPKLINPRLFQMVAPK